MRRVKFPVGRPAKRYSPVMSVSAVRFNPVLWLTTVTAAPGMTAPLGGGIAPKTVASWVCDRIDAENRNSCRASNMHGLYEAHLVDAIITAPTPPRQHLIITQRASCTQRR